MSCTCGSLICGGAAKLRCKQLEQGRINRRETKKKNYIRHCHSVSTYRRFMYTSNGNIVFQGTSSAAWQDSRDKTELVQIKCEREEKADRVDGEPITPWTAVQPSGHLLVWYKKNNSLLQLLRRNYSADLLMADGRWHMSLSSRENNPLLKAG